MPSRSLTYFGGFAGWFKMILAIPGYIARAADQSLSDWPVLPFPRQFTKKPSMESPPGDSSGRRRLTDGLCDLLRFDRGGVELGTKGCQRVGDGVGEGCRRCDGTPFTHSFDAERVERRPRMLVDHHHLGHVAGGRHHVVSQRTSQ